MGFGGGEGGGVGEGSVEPPLTQNFVFHGKCFG